MKRRIEFWVKFVLSCYFVDSATPTRGLTKNKLTYTILQTIEIRVNMKKSEYESMRTADIVAEALLDWKVELIFGLPGDGINGFIEALRTRQQKIKFILVRHEESAAFMACAYAKYTGKIGVCVATSGPGAIHLLNGLYDAKMDNTPVLAITGSTYSDLMNSNYQQDVN